MCYHIITRPCSPHHTFSFLPKWDVEDAKKNWTNMINIGPLYNKFPQQNLIPFTLCKAEKNADLFV